MINIKKENHDEGIIFYKISTPKYELVLANVGATIYDLKTYDKDGALESIVLKLKTPEDLFKNDLYLGSSVGRNAGRIKDGEFFIGKKLFKIPVNNNGNNLHSSGSGVSQRIMASEVKDNSIRFSIILSSQDDGFPGDISISITYIFETNGFKIKYGATSTEDTICNITNHTYFNLSGNVRKDIFSQSLNFKDFKTYWDLDDTNIPKIERKCKFSSISDFTNSYIDKPQRGMDHPFITKDNKISLTDKETGRILNIKSSYNCVVLYTQNFKSSFVKNKINQGIAIEFQYLPNDININKNNSKTILKKGKEYNEWTSYSF